MENAKEKKISYRQKNLTKCPVCMNEFYREEMLTGSGRLIAGKLSPELRRIYEKNQKYGLVVPMAYVLTVCPRCLYTAYPKDFNEIPEADLEKVRGLSQARVNTVKKFFGDLSFEDDRNLELGAASYMLAIDVYSVRDKKCAPTFKRAVSSIRAAWLFGDLAVKYPDRPYSKISLFFYTKAYGFYEQVIELLQTGLEPVDAAGNMGPDTDKNWGYDGILYLYAFLTTKIGSRENDIAKRILNYEKTKRYLSRIFGAGKASKSKPSQILDMTRDLYDKMNEQLDKWTQEGIKE
ncbi:MAG: DUF2225 domain-containing protein [Spirochaetes bacterium]|nr:DUF2225 domain-containing protein [Spirochaetota bacterium]